MRQDDEVGITDGRVYGGMTPADRESARLARLMEGGLEAMGAPGEVAVTVRRVIECSGVAPRYFYDHFDSLEHLQIAVFDNLIEEAERLALEAMLAAPRVTSQRVRAVLEAMVDLLLDDPRKGRVLLVAPLSSPMLGPRYAAEVRRFARLLAEYSPTAWRGAPVDSRPVQITAQFAIGGFTSSVAAVLTGELPADRGRLVDELTVLFLGLGSSFRRLPT